MSWLKICFNELWKIWDSVYISWLCRKFKFKIFLFCICLCSNFYIFIFFFRVERESFGSITMSFSNVSRVTVLGLRFPAAGTTRILQMEIRPLPSQTFSKLGPRKENYCKFICIYFNVGSIWITGIGTFLFILNASE